MACWLNLGQILKVNAKKFPGTVALKDRERSLTYPELNRRVNQLAHSLLALGLKKGDKVAVLLENSIEIIEAYLATAKTGIVIVPINFRLTSADVEFIAGNSDARAFIVHDEFVATVDPVRPRLAHIPHANWIVVGNPAPGYRAYEAVHRRRPRERARSRGAPGGPLDPDLHLRDHRQAQRGGAHARVAHRLLPDQCDRLRLQRARRVPERHAAVPHQLHLLHLHLYLHRRLGRTSTPPAPSARKRSSTSSRARKSPSSPSSRPTTT